MSVAPAIVHNGQALLEAQVFRASLVDFRRLILNGCHDGGRLTALFGRPLAEGVRLYALVARDRDAVVLAHATDLPAHDLSYAALTPELPQAHWFERELAEQFGVRPEGHPWLKPLRFPRRAAMAPAQLPHQVSLSGPALGPGAPLPIPGAYPFFQVQGEEIHEVAVGPVHAGIIEPGHFRFQCHGEEVLHLEIQLGYQHRGAEQLLEGSPLLRGTVLAESLAGDTSIGHGLAYCEAREALAGCLVPARALVLRGIALELERLANHVGDLGALGADIGFLPTSAYFGRLRGEFLNLTMELTGSRYGRGFLCPGGVHFDMTASMAEAFRARLDKARGDLERVADLFFSRASVLARLEATGQVNLADAEALGLVGPAGRASGCDRDVRRDHPSGVFRFAYIPALTLDSGDVYARAWMRRLEAMHSLQFLSEQLTLLPAGQVRTVCPPPRPNHLAVSLVEGWRGEILHALITDEAGRIVRHKVKDPSFHNWMGLAVALRGNEISDFPLCNKSFNLSYAGHDL
jgi:Ni,Fe-hydrogenase III large subunit